MAGNGVVGAGGAVVGSDHGRAAANGGSRILLKAGGFQVNEMSGLQFCGVVADCTGVPFAHMCVMFARVIAVVLGCTGSVTGDTLRVDIDNACRPARGGLAAMASGTGTGAVGIGNSRTTFGIEAGQNCPINDVVIVGRTIMTSVASWGRCTKTQSVMLAVGTLDIRESGA